MEFAYDHIQEEIVAPDQSNDKGKEPERPKESLNEEFQEAYKAFSASPWGAKFGSFIGTVKKQGESYYETGKKEAATRAEQASKGFSVVRSEIVNRTRSLSINQSGPQPPLGQQEGQQMGETSKDGAVTGENEKAAAEGLLSKLKKGAAQKISEIEAAETRADEYLLRFGTNIGNFLKEAVTIRPPEGSEEVVGEKEVVFEQKGEEGKRHIYSTRLDAQLHLLHGNLELFKADSTDKTFIEWSKDFSADGKTEQIAADLEKYPELRSTMEKLVPDSVQYVDFWRRYYFLRNELDMEEQKRKELLKGATSLDEEEVAWDEDDEEDSDTEKPKPTKEVSNPMTKTAAPITTAKTEAVSAASTETLIPKEELLKPKSSIDRSSQPDSESSYDLVSGVPSKAASQTAGSPKAAKTTGMNEEDESEDDDDDDDDDDDSEDGDDDKGGEEEEEDGEEGSSEEDWE